MTRRMSCSMTTDAVKARTKTVTRRHVDTWTTLKPGDRLTLIEKGMGLPKGAHQVVLAEVEIVDVRVDEIGLVCGAGECTKEGFPQWEADPDEFIIMWCNSHGHAPARLSCGALRYELLDVPCRRIEWRYLDEAGR